MNTLRDLLRFRLLQLLALTAFMTGIGAECLMTKYSVRDLDVWWHLEVGNWIVGHRTFPQTGIFSQTAGDRTWRAYSWGYEVLLSRAYAWFGLLGMGLYGVALTLAVAGAVFWMSRRLSRRFWVAWTLSSVACYAFLFSLMPRPVFFSMMLFAIVLALLLEAQRLGRAQLLYWLPLIFLLWANLHIQFIYGLFVVGLFVAISLLQHFASSLRIAPSLSLLPGIKPTVLIGVLGACVLATNIGPYSFHVYEIVLSYATSRFPYSSIVEFQSLNFTATTHFVIVLLAVGGFMVVGWQRKLDLFKLALLTIASVVAFRTTRDSWFICITAVALIADFAAEERQGDQPTTLVERGGVAVAIVLLLLLIARNTDFNTRGLDRAISRDFPVDAVNFLRQNPAPGPLYNSFDWGGFLIWYMPQYPVAIDGRTDLYGDELDEQFFRTEAADPSYTQDPYLNGAGLILLNTDIPLANALSIDRRFRAIYRDHIAVVYVPR